jgi:hypothetical protein
LQRAGVRAVIASTRTLPTNDRLMPELVENADWTPDRGASGVGCSELHSFGEVKRQQVADVRVRCPLWHFGQHMMQIRVGLDVAGPARQHEAVDHGTRLRARNCVREEPRMSRCCKWPDVSFQNVMPTPGLCRVMHARGGGYCLS